MQYIKGLENYNYEHFTAITIGKFDGLHLGHEMLIQKVREQCSLTFLFLLKN